MLKKIALPLIILVIGITASQAMMAFKKESEKRNQQRPAPSVEWVSAEISHPEISIHSQGTVQARQIIKLNSSVSGEIVWVSDDFLKGQFVKKGQALVRIDSANYELALANAQAAVAEAELKLTEEQTRFRQRQESSNTNNSSSRLPVKVAESRLKASLAQLKKAEKDLKDTTIQAPFNGIVQEKNADLGQVVSNAAAIGTLAGTDEAEVRLAVSAHEIEFLAPALIEQDMTLTAVLSAKVGAKHYQWNAKVDRMDGAIDPQTRVFYLTATVEKPYQARKDHHILPFGLFINAKITTPVIENVFVLPGSALFENEFVYILRGDNTLAKTAVQVIRKEEKRIFINQGLMETDKVIITRPDLIFDGMQVQASEATTEETGTTTSAEAQ